MMPDMQHGRTRGQLLDHIAELQAKLDAVRQLPDRWRPRFETGDDGSRVRIDHVRTGGMCANELEAALNQQEQGDE